MTISEAAKYLKENPLEYINKLMQFPDKVLERKLDIVREQKKMAYELQKKDSFDLLYIKEELIIQARLMKSENETDTKPQRKPIKKKIIKFEEDITKALDTEESQNTEIDVKQNDKPEQLIFDF